MAPVGRPPEVDSEGNAVLKCLVNVTIPTKLANFLKEKGINRSKLFTEIVGKMYNKELCPRCYNETVTETLLGWYCEHCAKHKSFNNEIKHIALKECQNCETEYHPPYNMFAQSKEIEKGCWDCIPKEERK
jgi:hypothetical protein